MVLSDSSRADRYLAGSLHSDRKRGLHEGWRVVLTLLALPWPMDEQSTCQQAPRPMHACWVPTNCQAATHEHGSQNTPRVQLRCPPAQVRIHQLHAGQAVAPLAGQGVDDAAQAAMQREQLHLHAGAWATNQDGADTNGFSVEQYKDARRHGQPGSHGFKLSN